MMTRRSSSYFVYILECENGNLYTGITNDVARRFEEHKLGKGARYTRSFGAVRIVYTEECAEKKDALRREVVIKRLSRSKKIALIREAAR